MILGAMIPRNCKIDSWAGRRKSGGSMSNSCRSMSCVIWGRTVLGSLTSLARIDERARLCTRTIAQAASTRRRGHSRAPTTHPPTQLTTHTGRRHVRAHRGARGPRRRSATRDHRRPPVLKQMPDARSRKNHIPKGSVYC